MLRAIMIGKEDSIVKVVKKHIVPKMLFNITRSAVILMVVKLLARTVKRHFQILRAIRRTGNLTSPSITSLSRLVKSVARSFEGSTI
jgi:hypothetical protein